MGPGGFSLENVEGRLRWRATSSTGRQRYARVQLVRRATAYVSIWLHIGGVVVGDNS